MGCWGGHLAPSPAWFPAPEGPCWEAGPDLSVVLNSGSNAAAVPTRSCLLIAVPRGPERASGLLKAAQQSRGQALGLSGWVLEGEAGFWAAPAAGGREEGASSNNYYTHTHTQWLRAQTTSR